MAKKEPVRTPLTPEKVFDLGRFSLPRDFSDPVDWTGAWQQDFLIWIHHGYVHDDRPFGLLRIERTPDGDGRFGLNVTQLRYGKEKRVNVFRARIRCLENDWAQPIDWTVRSWFQDLSGFKFIADSTIAYEGRLRDGAIEESFHGNRVRRPVEGPLISPFGLMETLQRAPATARPASFTSHPDLRLLKPGQRLVQLDRLEASAALPVSLGGWKQIGPGCLPFEYWQAETGRIACIISAFDTWVAHRDSVRRLSDHTGIGIQNLLDSLS